MKYKLTLLLLIIIAVVSGYYLGTLCLNSGIPYLTWLGLGLNFGFDTISVDLNMLQFTFGLHMNINFLQIILTVILVALSKKIADSIKTG